MSQPAKHHTINYIEFAAEDVALARQFYSTVFGWTFEDYGPEYTSFHAARAGIDGGFRKSTPGEPSGSAAPLVVIYSSDLKATEAAITTAGGSIVVPTFEFPGGRRFHFSDPVGNTLAVWSE
ncbi:MAG TPA: VOC family protein [Terracidiphilus sp.]|nr:VOC family protein [Terracidiphilus sp.]